MPTPCRRPDLVLYNARAITLNARQPAAGLVAIRDDRIVGVSSSADLGGFAGPDTRAIDCQGQTLAPGFIDAHCHLMAYASSLLTVDCGPRAVTSIADIKQALHERAAAVPPGQWVRGTGYNDFALRERRHPSRWDLDDAVPNHPLRLNHRSGHACVLNSAALARVGISAHTPDPVGGVIDRDWNTGEPTGLLMEMDDYLDSRIPPLSETELRRGFQLAGQRLASLGITSVQDATHSNSPDRWVAFGRLKAEGSFLPRVTMMVGAGHLEAFLQKGLGFGAGDRELSLGAVKIMLSMTTGALRPSAEELGQVVARAHEAGFPVAIHAVEAEAVETAAQALANARNRGSRTRDRIEHCSETPTAVLAKLTRAGVVVVTQPGFLYYSGQRYLAAVAQERQPWLYRIGSFVKAGLRPAASSDAPVIEPNPLVGIYAAVTRRSETGEEVAAPEGVSAMEALQMYTLSGAFAAHQEADKGSIEVGKLADLALLDRDLTTVEPEEILGTRVTLTVKGGQVVWQA